MAKVYVSSTYKDLIDHREAVCRGSRRGGGSPGRAPF